MKFIKKGEYRMTDQAQDQATEQPEAAGSPTPKFSDVSQGADSKAQTDAGLAKQVADLQAQVRAMQSGKDKALDRVSREVESFKKYLPADMHEKLDKAAREAAIDELISTNQLPSSAKIVPGRTVKDEYLDRATKILKNLSPEDQQIVFEQVATQEFSSLDDAIIAVGDARATLLANNVKKAQPASLASAISQPGIPVKTRDADAIVAQLDLLYKGNVADPNNRKAREALTTELAELTKGQ
jgi:hypothetical protein